MSLSRGREGISFSRDLKIRFLCWRIIYRLILSITWRISFRNLFYEFLNLFCMRRRIYYVWHLLRMMLMKLVAGDHTRTISVAAPTVGGLMKFAVKTQTCLGCKTPLPKGVSSQYINFLTFRGP